MPRILDTNGFVSVADNPISKVGVFDYLGREINAPEPNRMYRVYRPESELNNPETIESFKLLPFIDDHVMLGAMGVPAEQKGIQGVIGEQVRFDYPYLRGNLMIHSSAAQKLIDNGKVDLSPGYISRYEFTSGVFDGQAYDAIQRNIRGNHLALVKEGRTGKDIAVLDSSVLGHFTITLDSMEVLAMPTTIEELIALIKQAFADLMAEQAAAKSTAATTGDAEGADPAGDPATVAKTGDDDGAAIAAAEAVVESANALIEAVAGTEAAPVMDALLQGVKQMASIVKTQDASIKSLTSKVATIDSGATILNNIAEATTLYGKVTPLVGNFDHAPASRTVQGIAEYSCEKLKLNPVKGQEVATLNGYLAAMDAAAKTPAVNTTDSATGNASGVDAVWGKQGEK